MFAQLLCSAAGTGGAECSGTAHAARAAGASVVLAPCHCSVSVMFRMMIISGYNLSLVQTFKPLIKIRERRVTFDTQ